MPQQFLTPCGIGYARLFDSAKPEAVSGSAPVELNRIYVDQTDTGKGYGSVLMEACLDTVDRAGYQTIWLGVWEKNVRAIAFYEKWGFRAVGSQRFVLGSDVQRDVLMDRPVKLVSIAKLHN